MSIQIVCINKDGGNHDNPHEAISHYGWHNDSTNTNGKSTRDQMVDWLEIAGNEAYVTDIWGNKVFCYIRPSVRGTKFLQTKADGNFTNNLLQLNECYI